MMHRPECFQARKEADRLACVAWNQRMLGYWCPAQPSPALGDALNAIGQPSEFVTVGVLVSIPLAVGSFSLVRACFDQRRSEEYVGDNELRGHVEPAPLEIEQQIAPVLRVLAGTIGEADQLLAAFRRRADQHEDALFFVFEPRFEMDAISPDVDVALGRQIALLPRGVLVEPAVLQSADGGCRQSGSILAKQRRQRLGEVASRNPLQVKDRQQRLDRLRAAHVGRQDRRREPDAARIGSRRLAIAYTRLADGDRTDTGHHLALRQVAVADDELVAVLGLQIGMLAEKVCDLGFDRLGEKGTCPVAQDFCELIVEYSWLNQLDDVIVGHGISLLRWRSGGVKHPHDMPPSRFPPSPTSGDSS